MKYENLLRHNLEAMTIDDFDFDYGEMNYYLNQEIDLLKETNKQIEREVEELNLKISINKKIISELDQKVEQNRKSVMITKDITADEDIVKMVDY